MKVKTKIIHDERKSKGYSQDEIAHLLNISQSQYSKLENGEITFDLKELGTLLDILSLNPLDVIEFSEKQQVFINSSNSGNINSNFNNNDIESIRKIVQEELNKK